MFIFMLFAIRVFYFKHAHSLQTWYETLKAFALETEFITLSKEEVRSALYIAISRSGLSLHKDSTSFLILSITFLGILFLFFL